ncbi:MAG TPA: class I SAM-dependent methyltransferase [Fimbriimonadaceae bacterium]|nr:class I SAM-dependent methyltransferase [Fimbriimonadaceae bacterium]HRJ97150.1 class I SAM-dependent methyltransferase [Fimbriimonadaceae bacterium]
MAELLTTIAAEEALRRFRSAEDSLASGNDTAAESHYQAVLADPGLRPLALVRLGEIANRQGRAEDSADCHRRAFEAEPRLAARITPADHGCHGYVYQRPLEVELTHCPLCMQEGRPYRAFNLVTNIDFIPGFDPVRLWMRCEACEHLFASAYPVDLANLLAAGCPEHHRYVKADLLPSLAPIVGELRRKSPGDRWLEVGVGAGELTALALEFGFEVEGLDIRTAYAESVEERLGVSVQAVDFQDFEPGRTYDTLVMGDVLEHIALPTESIEKAARLLTDGGILWVSTPNYQSAFSRLVRDLDPMWRVCEHLNYFSSRSLRTLLERSGFDVEDYRVSSHYFGSMEVTARKVR